MFCWCKSCSGHCCWCILLFCLVIMIWKLPVSILSKRCTPYYIQFYLWQFMFLLKKWYIIARLLLIRKCISGPVLVLPPLLEWLCHKYHWSPLHDRKKLHYVTFWGEDQYVHNAWCPVPYPGICYVFIDGIFSRKRIIVKVYQIMLNSMKRCTIV